MSAPHIQTQRLDLSPRTRADAIAMVDAMSPSEKAELSPDWLERLHASTMQDPWIHGFALTQRDTGMPIGTCGFRGPPEADGVVEIAYGVHPKFQGNGYATEAAAALVTYAFGDSRVRVVRAHTLPEPGPSTRVLTKCGFRHVGVVIDPEDGVVWRWERQREGAA